ncbi:hypothetical protein [Pedococcus cremeus]|uniref:hypothetical protein n=1 Tax=Pedococcus cremeus TaxID=587636 RepID=UPI00115FE90E|nr:hypothetical protein [Pedococcus cremeus]
MGFYTSLGGGRRTSGHAPAAAGRSVAAAAKAEAAQDLARALQNIENLHRAEFTVSQKPVALETALPDEAAIRRRHRRAARAGVGFFDLAGRRQAKAAADAAAQDEISAESARLKSERGARQAELDASWESFTANDPELVMGALFTAFEDNDAPAAPVAVDGDSVSVVVLVPDVDVVPERYPTTTDAGNLSLRKMTKSQQADLYTLMVCGLVLVTVKEAFAVAPGLEETRVVAIRVPRQDAYGQPVVEPVLACSVDRSALRGIQWGSADAGHVLADAATELVINRKGAAKVLTPLDLGQEPDIARVLERVDVGELLQHG